MKSIGALSLSEREHWLSITSDPEWKRNHITDPNISIDETVEAIVSAFPERSRRVLEIGCGYGRLTKEVGRRVEAKMFGLDVNPQVLEEAERYDLWTTFLCGDSITLTGLDAIYSVAVFQHLPDSEKHAYITESFEALTPGGVLRVQFIEGSRDNFVDHWCSAEQMVLWAHDAGFTQTGVTRGMVHPQWTWLKAVK